MSGQGDSSISKSGSEFPGYVHKTTPRFWDCYQRLPPAVQKLADKQFERLKEDATHPSLRLEKLQGYDYWSVRVTRGYRAVASKNRLKPNHSQGLLPFTIPIDFSDLL